MHAIKLNLNLPLTVSVETEDGMTVDQIISQVTQENLKDAFDKIDWSFDNFMKLWKQEVIDDV